MNKKEDESQDRYVLRCMYGILLDTIDSRIKELEREKQQLLTLYRAEAGHDYTPVGKKTTNL